MDGVIYIGLPPGGGPGDIEISIPGGSVVYRGAIGPLHDKLLQTLGGNVPLDSVDVPASARSKDDSLIPAPTGGSPEASGLMAMDLSRLASPESMETMTSNGTQFQDIPDAELAVLIQANLQRAAERLSPKLENGTTTGSESVLPAPSESATLQPGQAGPAEESESSAGGNSAMGADETNRAGASKAGLILLILFGACMLVLMTILLAGKKKV